MDQTEHSIRMKNGDIIHVSYEVYSKLEEELRRFFIPKFVSFQDTTEKMFLTINTNEIMYIK